MIQRPARRHFQPRGLDPVERKGDISVALADVASLGRPEVGQSPVMKVVDQIVQLRIAAKQLVTDRSDDGAWPRDASHLAIEGVELEPVQRLGHQDKVDGIVLDRYVLGRRNFVADARIPVGVADLLGAGVGGDDLVEIGRQAQGRLAGSGGSIPGPLAARRHFRQPPEEILRIPRSESGVATSGDGEMVLEHGFAKSVADAEE